MRLVPVVVLVTDETIERLRPVLDALVEAITAHHEGDTAWAMTCRFNGWDPEMIAWGHVLLAASREELEVVRHD